MTPEFLKELSDRLPEAKAASEKAVARLHTRAAVPTVSRQDIRDVMSYVSGISLSLSKALLDRTRKDLPAATMPGVAKWAGIYSERSGYSKDAMVAHGHGLWIAEMATAAKPGTPGSGWRLVIKGPR